MMMIEVSGRFANQSIGPSPRLVVIQANSPFTGCISMFFQISALTVGMTKNGAIASRRATPQPKNSWSNSTASRTPSTTVMISTPPTSSRVLSIAVQSAGSVSSHV